MFTSGGQPDLWCVVARGGGKGGGGGGSAPQVLPPIVLTDPVNGKTFIQQPGGTLNANTGQIDYTSAQDQLNAEIADRQAQEKATSDTAATQKTTDSAKAETDFQKSRQDAYDTAMTQITNKFRSVGADPTQYMDTYIKPALQRSFQSVKDLDPNPTAAFSPDLGSSIINDITSGNRTQSTNALNQTFTPNYSSTMLPDTLTSGYIGNILDQQFNPLSTQLDYAQKRGTLGGAGYKAAMDALANKRTAATAQINTLGQNILNTDRSGLDTYIKSAQDAASSQSLAGGFDPASYVTGAQGKVSDYTNQFGSALQNAVGDTKYADINDLINAGGAAQGAQNPNAANPAGKATTAIGGGPLSPDYVDPDVAAQKGRGLGSTGAF